MAYKEDLALRAKEVLASRGIPVEEKKMFGGLCYMVDDKMLLGIEQNRLMVRLDPARANEVLKLEGCRPMDFTGRPMKGFVFVDPAVLVTRQQFEYWLDLALEYNRVAPRSKKKQK
jgi:TfoX/Sxy family transcriptional regulator of competence genes